MVKESACKFRRCRSHRSHRFDPWVGKFPWRRKWQPTPIFLPEKSHGQWSLVGYNPQGLKESDMTEHACTIRNKASVVIDVWQLVDQLKFGRFLYFPQKMNF